MPMPPTTDERGASDRKGARPPPRRVVGAPSGCRRASRGERSCRARDLVELLAARLHKVWRRRLLGEDGPRRHRREGGAQQRGRRLQAARGGRVGEGLAVGGGRVRRAARVHEPSARRAAHDGRRVLEAVEAGIMLTPGSGGVSASARPSRSRWPGVAPRRAGDDGGARGARSGLCPRRRCVVGERRRAAELLRDDLAADGGPQADE